MRYAIFSDVHSNLHALQAVLTSCQKESIDLLFNAGDVVGYGAFPNECVGLVHKYAALSVAGNHDWASVGLFPADQFNAYAREAVEWTKKHLSPGSAAYLRDLPLVEDSGPVTIVHGTLEEPEKFEYLMNGCDVARTFRAMRTQVCFVGHTHSPEIYVQGPDGAISEARCGAVSIEPGKKYIVNVGSVGQPRDHNPAAAYCIFDDLESSVVIRRVQYDIGGARLAIIAAELPRILGDRLMVGQ